MNNPNETHLRMIRRINREAYDIRLASRVPGVGAPWGSMHRDAWTANAAQIPAMLTAAARYADRHRAAFGSGIGQDGFLGPAWAAMLRAVRVLLNGTCGELDRGTCDRIILSMLEREGFDEDE